MSLFFLFRAAASPTYFNEEYTLELGIRFFLVYSTITNYCRRLVQHLVVYMVLRTLQAFIYKLEGFPAFYLRISYPANFHRRTTERQQLLLWWIELYAVFISWGNPSCLAWPTSLLYNWMNESNSGARKAPDSRSPVTRTLDEVQEINVDFR